MSWEAQAQEIAAMAGEIGEDAALISAAAWRARVDPRATVSLTQAALALGASPESLVRGGGRPLPHDRELLARADDIQAGAATLLRQAGILADQASRALEAAQAAARAAAAAQKAAKDHAGAAAAASALAGAMRQMGDCEAALDILDDTGERLTDALTCLFRVPDDLSETYEAAYSVVRRGGRLPFDGDFLTGVRA